MRRPVLPNFCARRSARDGPWRSPRARPRTRTAAVERARRVVVGRPGRRARHRGRRVERGTRQLARRCLRLLLVPTRPPSLFARWSELDSLCRDVVARWLGREWTPSPSEKLVNARRRRKGRPNPCTHRRTGWSIYGAKRAQPVASGHKWERPKDGANRPFGSRWQPTATVSERMVRRGSTVRVRQRALQRRRALALSCSGGLAGSAVCGGYEAAYGVFKLTTRPLRLIAISRAHSTYEL